MIPIEVSNIAIRILKSHGELTLLEATEAAFRVVEMRKEIDRLAVKQNATNVCKALHRIIHPGSEWL